MGLSAIRAAAARNALVLDDLAIKVVLGLEDAAKEYPAVYADTGALEAGVVRLYGVVIAAGLRYSNFREWGLGELLRTPITRSTRG